MSVYRVGSNKSSVNNFPSVRPTLDLDFANSKTLDPRITFTRASGGSYVGADGLIKLAGVNEARFDHDPVTGESLGLLVEESRTNLLTGSDYSSNNSLSNVTLTLNATTAPDGTNTAVSMSGETSANNVKYIYKNFSTSTIETYTTSIFAKYNGEQFILLRLNDNTGVNDTRQRFDILNGIKSGNVVNGGTATGASSTITAYPNGWYRLSVTCTFNSPFTNIQGAAVYLTGFTTTTTTNGVYMWGAQLEVGSFPTSYIPTVASTRTRAIDNASITGRNFSDFYRQDEGTIYSNISVNDNIPFSRNGIFYSLNDGAVSNRITLFANSSSTSLVGRYSVSGVQVSPILTSLTSPKNIKTTFSFQSSNIILLDNQRTSNLFPSGYPTVNELDLGNQTNAQHLNGTISRFTYYPKRLTNAQLQALTK